VAAFTAAVVYSRFPRAFWKFGLNIIPARQPSEDPMQNHNMLGIARPVFVNKKEKLYTGIMPALLRSFKRVIRKLFRLSRYPSLTHTSFLQANREHKNNTFLIYCV